MRVEPEPRQPLLSAAPSGRVASLLPTPRPRVRFPPCWAFGLDEGRAPGLAPLLLLVSSPRAALCPTAAWVRVFGAPATRGRADCEAEAQEPGTSAPRPAPASSLRTQTQRAPQGRALLPRGRAGDTLPASPLRRRPAPQLTGPLGASAEKSRFPHTRGGGHGHPRPSRFQALAARRSLSS